MSRRDLSNRFGAILLDAGQDVNAVIATSSSIDFAAQTL